MKVSQPELPVLRGYLNGPSTPRETEPCGVLRATVPGKSTSGLTSSVTGGKPTAWSHTGITPGAWSKLAIILEQARCVKKDRRIDLNHGAQTSPQKKLKLNSLFNDKPADVLLRTFSSEQTHQ